MLSFAILFLFGQLSPRCVVLNTDRKCEQLNTLAPPPIWLSGPVPSNGERQEIPVHIGTKKLLVYYDTKSGEMGMSEGEREPTYPFIIVAPNKKFWIKLTKTRPWVSLESLEGDTDFLNTLLKGLMGDKPPDEPRDENGGGHEWYDPPFKVGDMVNSLMQPGLGNMMVTKVWLKLLPNLKVFIWFVRAVHKIQEGHYTEFHDFAANFKKAGS